MRVLKKIALFILLASTCLSTLAACGGEKSIYGGDEDAAVYDPYDNILKDPVDTGALISVAGKTFVFDSIDIRTANAEKEVTAGNSLKKLYRNSCFRFTAENKVLFEEGAADDEYFFVMNESEGVRAGNVLTVKHTNSAGVEYDVRFEIHEDKIYVIHNGHTYDQEGVFSTLTFVLKK